MFEGVCFILWIWLTTVFIDDGIYLQQQLPSQHWDGTLRGVVWQEVLLWSKVGEKSILGLDVLQEAEEKVRITCQRLVMAQSR